MRNLVFIGILLFAVAAVAYPVISGDADSQESTQSICPVSSKEIDKNIYTNFEGQRIYFCSQASKEAFLKNPKIYLPNLILSDKGALINKPAAKKSSGSDCGT